MPSAARRKAQGIGWSQVAQRALVADSTWTATVRFAAVILSAAICE
ncbi:hypothetical protein [Dactylosporangium sp. NPDC005555]